MSKQIAVGIDLGTSNSALAASSVDEGGLPAMVPVVQAFSFQTVGDAETLPSCLYLPAAAEAEGAAVTLPWGESALEGGVVGRLARERGALVPDRLVSSAKSWLCNPHADPTQPLLPWQSAAVAHKLSAQEASRRVLRHLRLALEHARLQTQGAALADCEVVLTVPASFDEVARNLTHEAAVAAGWGQVTLLEEQQAAFYHWIAQAGDAWRERIQPGDLVLICDVGGGTADFSLVAVSEDAGLLRLDRVSVGDHILLGGDNMDLALAHALRGELEGRGQKLDAWQFLALVHGCRLGKERLFEEPELAAYPISVPSRGAGLFAGAVGTELHREHLDRIALEGFFPATGIDAHPQRRRQMGLREIGLAYEADPVLTKHLALFLARSQRNARSSPELWPLVEGRVREGAGIPFVLPTAILFNGGVFRAAPLRRRVLETLERWGEGVAVRELEGAHLDLAVARGAAVYARTLARGEGVRIRAGTARSYYVGLEVAMPAVPGLVPPVKAVCVVPQGMEEGSEATLEGQEFGLVTGETVEFRFFSSSVRAGDAVGTVLEGDADLEETASLEVLLPAPEGGREELVPVRLHSTVTELGTLELWMVHAATGRRWKVEFNVRGEA